MKIIFFRGNQGNILTLEIKDCRREISSVYKESVATTKESQQVNKYLDDVNIKLNNSFDVVIRSELIFPAAKDCLRVVS